MAENLKALVSLHIPKTGGTTLMSILRDVYGDRIQFSYRNEMDVPVDNPLCYHGHALMDDYSEVFQIERAAWIIFLRDPLSSAISLYHYSKKHGEIAEEEIERWLVSEKPFCWPQSVSYNHNRFTKWIERARGRWENFQAVGITECFDESISYISKILEWPPIQYSTQNVGDYEKVDLPDEVVSRFKELNASDYNIYNSAKRFLLTQP